MQSGYTLHGHRDVRSTREKGESALRIAQNGEGAQRAERQAWNGQQSISGKSTGTNGSSKPHRNEQE